MSDILSGNLKSRLLPYFTAILVISKLLTREVQFFDMLGSTGMTMLYPKESSQLPLVWAHGRAARHGGSPPSRRLCVFEHGRYFGHLLVKLKDIQDFGRTSCSLKVHQFL